MGTAVPTWVRVAIGLAILGVGVSLAFIFMPDSTTYMRVGASIACAACLAFVALVWRRIRTNQEIYASFKDEGSELDAELQQELKQLTEEFKGIEARKRARGQVERDRAVLRKAGFK